MRLLPLLLAAVLAAPLATRAPAGAAPPPDGAPLPAVGAPLPAVATKLAPGSNALGYRLYRELAPGNGALSPVSIELALAMTAAGARGETRAQMERTLGLDGEAPEAWGAVGQGLVNHGAEIAVANRLFVERSFPLGRGFLELQGRSFGASVEPVAFATDPEAARARLNGWVAGKTNQRIKDLVPAGGVGPATRLALVNAIYLLARWDTAFKAKDTFAAPFHLDPQHEARVPTMHRTGSLRSGAAEGARIVELPYQKGTLAMTVIVPDVVDGLPALEAKLSNETLARIDAALGARETEIALPRFTIDPTAPLPLGPALAAAGMPDAFDAQKADFSGMTDGRPSADLAIGQVFHKAFVKVDESGTEAAAATAVTISVTSAMPSEPFAVIADRPFLFLVRDTKTGLVLFLGRVTRPV